MLLGNAEAIITYTNCIDEAAGFLIGLKTPLPEVYQQAVQLECLVEVGKDKI